MLEFEGSKWLGIYIILWEGPDWEMFLAQVLLLQGSVLQVLVLAMLQDEKYAHL